MKVICQILSYTESNELYLSRNTTGTEPDDSDVSSSEESLDEPNVNESDSDEETTEDSESSDDSTEDMEIDDDATVVVASEDDEQEPPTLELDLPSQIYSQSQSTPDLTLETQDSAGNVLVIHITTNNESIYEVWQ